MKPKWDDRWDELNEFTMQYETAVIPFSSKDYLEEFYDFYHIKKRTAVLVEATTDFLEMMKEVSGYDKGELIVEQVERFFGLPKRIMVFDDDTEIRKELEGPDGLALFFFVFDLMFCEYEDMTLCFMSGTNN